MVLMSPAFLAPPTNDKADGAGEGLGHFTEATFAESPLADREFRLMVDHLPMLCWMANADGYIFWYNRRWYDYTGMTPAQAEGWGWRSVHDPDVLPAVMANWTNAIERGEPFEMTFPIRCHDGTFRPFLSRIQPVRDNSGRVTRWYGLNTDISGEAALESRLSESEATLRAFFETAGVYTAVLDLDDDDFTFQLANRRMARFWGAANGVTGRSARSLAGGELARGMMTVLKRGHSAGQPTTVEYPFEGPDGERWFTATLTPMPSGESGKPRLSIVSLDISARKRAEAALAQALETKDMLLHEVNHRVKNSLQLVTALLSLQAAQAADTALRGNLLEARGRVAVVASMHQRLYSTSAHDRVDMVGYLRELANENVAAHGAQGVVALNFDADEELVLELSRAVPLALIVGELLTNAFKYAFPDDRAGVVAIGVHRTDGVTRVTVADDGAGLPAGFSINRATSLGMKIVRSLSRQIGATVTVEDAAPGARFVIELR